MGLLFIASLLALSRESPTPASPHPTWTGLRAAPRWAEDRQSQRTESPAAPMAEPAGAGPLGARIKFRLAHAHDVLKLAWSADGKYLAAGAPLPTTLTIRDARDGSVVRTLPDQPGWVEAVAYSPDGRYLVTGRGALPPASDTKINIWDAKTGALVRNVAAPLENSRNSVRAISFSPDGKYLASRHEDHVVGLYSLKDGKWIKTFPSRTGFPGPVAFSPNGRHLAYAIGPQPHGYAIRVVDVGSGQVVKDLTGCPDIVHSLTYSPDGRRLVAGDSGTMCVYDLTAGAVERNVEHRPMIQLVAYVPTGRYLISASADRTIRVWDTKSWQVADTLTGHSGTLYVAALSRDGRHLAAAGNQAVTVWEFAK